MRRWIAAISAVAATVVSSPSPSSARTVSHQAKTTRTHPSVSLARQSETLAGDGMFSLDVEVSDLATLRSKADVELAVTVHQRMKTRVGFARTLRGADLGSVLGLVSPAPITPVSDGAPQTMRITVPVGSPSAACPACIPLGLDGVYPIHVELRERGGERVYDSFTTHLVYASQPNSNRLAVVLVVRLHLPPSRGATGRVSIPPVQGFGGLTEALLNHPLVPATIVPTPETIATIAEGGDPGIVDLVRGAVAGRELVSSTWVPWRLSDLDDPRLADELRRQAAAGRRALRRVIGAATIDDVLIADRAIPNRRALESLGVTRLVAPERSLASSAARLISPGRPVAFDPGPLVAGARDDSPTPALPLVVVDGTLQDHFSARLSDRRTGADDVLRAQQLLADLAMLHFDAPSRPAGVVVVVPERTPQTVLDILLSGIGADGQALRAGRLSELFDLEPRTTADGGAVERTAANDPPAPTTPLGIVQDSLRARTALDGYRSVFADSRPVDAQLAEQLGRSFSSDLSEQERRAYLTTLDREVRSRLAMVHLARPGRVTLTARRQEVPIVVENTSGRPVRVALEVSSDNLILSRGVPSPTGPSSRVERRTVRVPGRIGEEKVSVATRGPGSFSFVARLRTGSGFDLSIERYTVRSTVVSGLGKLLTVGALAFLGLWWSRSAIRGRRRRAASSHPARTSRNAP